MTGRIDDGLGAAGVAVVDLLPPHSLVVLRDLAAEIIPAGVDRFYPSVRDPDCGRRRAAHDGIHDVLQPVLSRLASEDRVVLCSIVAKPFGPSGEVPLHQDWSFVDDQTTRALNVWCPLEDVTSERGCLDVVPGSHRTARQPRAAGTEFAYQHLEPMLRADHLQPVPARCGQAVVYDGCIFHGSPVNQFPGLRVAVTALLVPADVPLRFYRSTDTDIIECYEVPDDFYLDHEIRDVPPVGDLVGRMTWSLS